MKQSSGPRQLCLPTSSSLYSVLTFCVLIAISIESASSVTLPARNLAPQTAILTNTAASMQHVPRIGQKESELAMNPIEVYAVNKMGEVDFAGNSPGAAEFQQLQDEMQQDSNPLQVLDDLMEPQDEDIDQENELQKLAKRSPTKWQSLQGGWGKRAPNNWNKLSAAWGKRRIQKNAAWNNLSGMWGKKRAKWNELSGMWGKRAAWRDMSGGWGKKKRSSNAPHWNKLRGMWGKRSGNGAMMINDAENHADDELNDDVDNGQTVMMMSNDGDAHSDERTSSRNPTRPGALNVEQVNKKDH